MTAVFTTTPTESDFYLSLFDDPAPTYDFVSGFYAFFLVLVFFYALTGYLWCNYAYRSAACRR